MLVLAIESSAKPVSVAVYRTPEEQSQANHAHSEESQSGLSQDGLPSDLQGGKLLGQYFQNNGFSHSRTLLKLAESLMSNLDIKPADIGLIAVSRGPGSFTGIRIGVSAAKGIAWGLEIPVCGVSTLEAMAYQTPKSGVIICPVMDARRDQVYNALFEWRDDVLVRLTDDRAISLEDLAVELRTNSSPVLLIGDGVSVCKGSGDFSDCREAPELLRYQTAFGVALAAMSSEPIPAIDLEPYYLRPSQAERERGIAK